MATPNQSHSGSGDNVGGNKILNLTFPKILIMGIIIILSAFVFIYWKSIKERFFFNEDQISVDVSVIDSLQISGLNEEEQVMYEPADLVYYDLAMAGDTAKIVSSAQYLNKFKHDEALTEGPVWGLYGKIPKINFKITNNSNKTVFFSKIVLEVEESKTDPMPIPELLTNECITGASNTELPIEIYNDAWNPMRNVVLNFNIVPSGEAANLNKLPFSVKIKQIDKEAYVDLFPFLRQQGVDVDRLIAVTEDGYEEYLDTLLLTTGLGDYNPNGEIPEERAQIAADIYGYMLYEDIAGKQYKNKFQLTMSLYREWGCGAPGLETGTYDIALCESGSNYEIVYPVSQYIKATDVDNFSVRLICSKSSQHKIKAKLYYSQDKYIEKYLDYNLLIPRKMVEDEVVKFKGNGKCIR